MTEFVRLTDWRKRRGPTFFDRAEFRKLLDLYAAHVAKGEWKDYAIDVNGSSASFSVFRHSFETPLFTITKRAQGRRTDYALASGPRVIKRGPTLADVLKPLNKPIKIVPGGRR